MTTATINTWESAIQRCQPTGISLRKSTLQKVTYKTRNINNGRAASRIGAKKFAAPSKAGIKAKTRYNKLPVAIDTGSVHSFINCMILLIFYHQIMQLLPLFRKRMDCKVTKKD